MKDSCTDPRLTRQGRIFQKIWLPSFTPKQVVYEKLPKTVMCLDYKVAKTLWRAELAQNRGQIWTQHAKKPYNNLLFDHIDGFEFFLIFGFKFWVIFLCFKRGQLPGSPHSAVVIISPVTRCNVNGLGSGRFWFSGLDTRLMHTAVQIMISVLLRVLAAELLAIFVMQKIWNVVTLCCYCL